MRQISAREKYSRRGHLVKIYKSLTYLKTSGKFKGQGGNVRGNPGNESNKTGGNNKWLHYPVSRQGRLGQLM